MENVIFFAKHMELGGLEKSLLNLLNSLDPALYDVDLVLEEKRGPLLRELGDHVTVTEYRLSDCPFTLLRRGINLCKRLLWTISHRNQYDFSCSYCTYSVIGSRLAQAASHNSCLYVHNDYTTIYPDQEEFRNFFQELRTDQFRKVLFVSNESREKFVGRLPELREKCATINNIVDWKAVREKALEPCPVKKEAGETLFCFVGRLSEPHKRLSRLIEAFAIAHQTRTDIRLLIVGDGEDRPLVEALIGKYGLGEAVTMVGSQNNPYPYLNAADCLVLSSDYEGFPVVYLEALILGKDIITTIPVSDDRVDIGRLATIAEKTPESLGKAMAEYHFSGNAPLDMEAINKKRMAALTEIMGIEKD